MSKDYESKENRERAGWGKKGDSRGKGEEKK